jgi:hypothetical protein
MACAICETRRPRRFCPGVRGDICSICCGTEREVTVDCPFECEYLQEARRHDRPVALQIEKLPNRDIRITEEWVEKHSELLMFVGSAVFSGAMQTQGAIDFDVRESLEALIRTYRTLESGVYYDSIPANPLAANIYRAAREAFGELRNREQQQLGMTRTRDAEVLGALVFLQHMELDRNNGRRRGRAFLDSLRSFYSPAAPSEAASSSPLILP